VYLHPSPLWNLPISCLQYQHAILNLILLPFIAFLGWQLRTGYLDLSSSVRRRL
jgi:hypothetical protein